MIASDAVRHLLMNFKAFRNLQPIQGQFGEGWELETTFSKFDFNISEKFFCLTHRTTKNQIFVRFDKNRFNS